MKILKCNVFFMTWVCMLCWPISGVCGSLDAVPDYKFVPCTQAGMVEFVKIVTQDKINLENNLKNKYPDKPEKISGNPAMIGLNFILDEMAELKNSADSNNALSYFLRLQRLHYSAKAEILDIDVPMVTQILNFGPNFLFSPIFVSVPNVSDPNRTLGKKASEEASNLVRPGSGKFVTRDEMAKMSHLKISRLEPPKSHSAVVSVKPGNHYSTFLNDMIKCLKMTDKKLLRFDLKYAMRVVYFDEVDPDATSPKIRVEDRFGTKWGMKWGDEVHADVVATRFFIDLGGRYADQKFFSGPGESILILPPKGNKKGDPSTWAKLSTILLKSKFKFHGDRYLLNQPLLKGRNAEILGHGQVDDKMVEEMSLNSKYKGCYFVKFKECQMVLFNPAIKRLGGVAMSNGGALEDRVARSTVVFNSWLNNPDFKEDNTRAGLVFNPSTGKFDQHVEYISDLGASFFSLFSAGNFSTLSGKMMNPGIWRNRFKTRAFFRPKCWKNCTWADARWMARRIAGLAREDYERVFSESGWPTFFQQLGIEKLISRRNELVKVFRLDLDGFKELPCNPRLTLKAKTPQGEKTVIFKGFINPQSSLVKELVETMHPEGLALVRPRVFD